MAIRALDQPASTDLILSGPAWAGVGVVAGVPYLRSVDLGLKQIVTSPIGANANGHVAFGNQGVIDARDVPGVTYDRQVVNVDELVTYGGAQMSADFYLRGVESRINATITSDTAAGVSELMAGSFYAENLNSTHANALNYVFGVAAYGNHNSPLASIDSVWGVYANGYVEPGSRVNSAVGSIYAVGNHDGPGLGIGVYAEAKLATIIGSGVMPDGVVCVAADYFQNNSPNALAYAAGLRVGGLFINTGGGSITTAYGVKIDDMTVGVTNYAIHTGTGLNHFGDAIELVEQAAPAAGAANSVRLFAQDNGAGKTQLMARFATGAAQQVAIEP